SLANLGSNRVEPEGTIRGTAHGGRFGLWDPKGSSIRALRAVFYHEKRGRNRVGLVAVQRHRRKTSWFDPCEKQIGARKWMDGILRFSAVISTAIRSERGCMSGTRVYQMPTSHATDL